MRSDLWDGRRSGPARPSAGFLTANTLRILPFSSCSCTELPAQSPDTPWPPHPTLLSVRRRPTQYRRTCPLPATPKKECPCLVSSRHRSKGKRLKPDTRSREIRKVNPVYPTTDQKRPEKRCPKYTRAHRYAPVHNIPPRRSRGGMEYAVPFSKKQPHPSKDDGQPREERQELPCGAAAGERLAGCADRERVNVCEADVGAVEAVVLGDLLEAGVVGLDKGDVDALGSVLVTGRQKVETAKRTEKSEAPCSASSTTWMVALSPAFTWTLAGSGTCGRHRVPGKGFLEGPMIWKGGTMARLMLAGPWSGPSVPRPMLT